MPTGQRNNASGSRRTSSLDLLLEHLREHLPNLQNRLDKIERRLDGVESRRSWKDSVIVVAIISGLFSILTSFTAYWFARPDPPPPTGEIVAPQDGQQLDIPFNVGGTFAHVGERHVWLAVRKNNVFYPRGEITRDPTFSLTIDESGRKGLPVDDKFSIVLMVIDDEGQQQIQSALQSDPSKGLEQISGRAQLDVVEDLSLTPPPQVLAHPLKAILPQSDKNNDGREEGRPYEFSDPKTDKDLKTAFTVASDCSREGRPIGLRINYDMRPRGSYGGWGILWTDPQSGPFDASGFSRLVLWVKSINGSAAFEVGLKDAQKHERKAQSKPLTVVEQQWQPLVVPLTEFTTPDPNPNRKLRRPVVDLSNIIDANLGFNENHGKGHICVDQIQFD